MNYDIDTDLQYRVSNTDYALVVQLGAIGLRRFLSSHLLHATGAFGQHPKCD